MWLTAEPASVSLIPMQNRPSPDAASGQPPLLQRLVAEVLDRPGRAVERELGEDRARHVGPGELLEDDRRLDVAHAHAAVLLVDRDAEEVGPADRVPGLLGELLGLVPVPGPRRQLPLGDVAGELAQRLLVLGLLERIGPPAHHGPEITPSSGPVPRPVSGPIRALR